MGFEVSDQQVATDAIIKNAFFIFIPLKGAPLRTGRL